MGNGGAKRGRGQGRSEEKQGWERDGQWKTDGGE